MNEEQSRQQKRLGKRFIAFALFQIIVLSLATISWSFLPWLGMLGRNENELMILVLTPLLAGWAFSFVSVLLFALSLTAGITILRNTNSARSFGLVTAYIALLEIPIGTIFGIYAIRRLKLPK